MALLRKQGSVKKIATNPQKRKGRGGKEKEESDKVPNTPTSPLAASLIYNIERGTALVLTLILQYFELSVIHDNPECNFACEVLFTKVSNLELHPRFSGIQRSRFTVEDAHFDTSTTIRFEYSKLHLVLIVTGKMPQDFHWQATSLPILPCLSTWPGVARECALTHQIWKEQRSVGVRTETIYWEHLNVRHSSILVREGMVTVRGSVKHQVNGQRPRRLVEGGSQKLLL
ncbi:hypothetical protein J3A83DRAFT_1816885 [Scleroderma citrinum]